MKCHICNKAINGNYYTDVWEHTVCAEHFNSGEITLCSSCKGFTNRKWSLSDNRVLCAACKNNVIDDNDDIDEIKDDVLYNLHKYGFGDLQMETISIEVVSAQQMAKIKDCDIDTNNRGLTLSQIKKTLSFFGSSQKIQHSIYILESLPKIEFAGTLAHELLHAWQVQNEIRPQPMWCEGLCNLGTYYTYLMMPSPLTKILKKGLLDNQDPIYGDGVRAVLKLESEIGIRGIIEKYKREYK